MQLSSYSLMASAYDSGTYGGSTYNNNSTSSSPAQSGAGTTSTSQSSSTTTSTAKGQNSSGKVTSIGTPPTQHSGSTVHTGIGFDILVIATVACFIIFISLFIFFWKRRKKNQQRINDQITPGSNNGQFDSR